MKKINIIIGLGTIGLMLSCGKTENEEQLKGLLFEEDYPRPISSQTFSPQSPKKLVDIPDKYIDFNDNQWDTSVWNQPERSNVQIEEGRVKITQNNGENDVNYLSTKEFLLKNGIVLERKVSLDLDSRNFWETIFDFDNGIKYKIRYTNNYGICKITLDITKENWITPNNSLAETTEKVDQMYYFIEKIVIDKVDNTFYYYLNDELKSKYVIDNSTFQISGSNSYHIEHRNLGYSELNKFFFDNFHIQNY